MQSDIRESKETFSRNMLWKLETDEFKAHIEKQDGFVKECGGETECEAEADQRRDNSNNKMYAI